VLPFSINASWCSGAAVFDQDLQWRCPGCRKQFSVLTGTPFHGTKIAVRKWVFVIFEMCSSRNGVSAREIERKYGLCPRTAWFMMHRIRETMKRDDPSTILGTIVADETYVGGSIKNMHKSQIKPIPIVPGGQRTWIGYTSLGREFARHDAVDHAQGEYVRYQGPRSHHQQRSRELL
jgi:hypothetical protein